MKKVSSKLVFSPTDLVKFLENPFVSWMDRYHLESPDKTRPDDSSEEDEIIQRKGLEHEKTYLRSLQENGANIVEVRQDGNAWESTAKAIHEGHDVIYQAALQHDAFAGYADFLRRVGKPSKLGSFSYEVADTKLARSAKPHFVIQLCCYAEMLESIQGVRPECLHVILGDASERRFRTADYFYYYQQLKASFLRQQAEFKPSSMPDPLGEGNNGRWESYAKSWMEGHDHLRLVAGISSIQIQRLRAADINTTAALAGSESAKVRKMLDTTHEKLRRQASLQIESRGLDRPLYEFVQQPVDDPRRGLALLPPASAMDVAFDMEGYPLIEGGREYLFGAVSHEANGIQFFDWWAHDSAQEKAAFENFIDWVKDRRRRDSSMHVYHYAAYEVTALKKLMGRYATRERDVDDLLRNGVFVDLYQIVRQGLRIGVGGYGLKEIEALYAEKRDTSIVSGGDSIVFYQRWLDLQDGDTWESSPTLKAIRDYNQDDCESTWELVRWLRGVQQQSGATFIPGQVKESSEDAKDRIDARSALEHQLLSAIPAHRTTERERWRVQELLASLLEFHWREARPVFWAMYHRHEMTEEQLFEDDACLSGLARTARPPEPIKKSMSFEYAFDTNQETKIHAGSNCFFAHDLDIRAEVLEFDGSHGALRLKLGPKALSACPKAQPPLRLNLIPDEYVSADIIADSICRVVSAYAQNGTLPSALDDFLSRRRPRIKGSPQGPLLAPGQRSINDIIDIIKRMDKTALSIQGPPGSGKTFTAARIIVDLLKAGKRVGVSANSHKAITNLMREVAATARELKISFSGVNIDEEDAELKTFASIEFAESIRKIKPSHQLIGGTAWAFSSPVAVGILDYLFVDEAGQVCVANLVGMIPSTRNVVLLGDQMQLGQPLQGTHPGESGQSTLQYLLQDKATIPDDLGIFLETTWRLHPKICSFISDAIYEGRLQPEPHTVNRHLILQQGSSPAVRRESGIQFVPVEHEGNSQGSVEEVENIQELISQLLLCKHCDKDGNVLGTLGMNDILVVAPYNVQVRMLKEALGPQARVGTIDKFQGQQAPVVVLSLCSSAGEASPRGIDFLFDRNRLNVAISRAQCLAIVVGNPSLASSRCTSLKHLELTNLFCRILDEGHTTEIATAFKQSQ